MARKCLTTSLASSIIFGMMKLFLDDIRNPDFVYGLGANREWQIARSYDDFVNAVLAHWSNEGDLPTHISFDHDLGGVDDDGNELEPGSAKTGLDCLKWLIDLCLDLGYSLPDCSVHSANPVGATNLLALIDNFNLHSHGVR